MSRTHKRQETRCHRAPKGAKQAKRDGYRHKAIPPDRWSDIMPDNQCFIVQEMINRMFNDGIELEEIEKKIFKNHKLERWQWDEIIRYTFTNRIKVHEDEIIAVNDDCTEVIPISTPDAEPCIVFRVLGLPIKDRIVVLKDQLLRYQIKDEAPDGNFYKGTISCSRLFPFPNKKLTEIFVWVRDHYIANGMIYWYEISKWQLGLEKCKIYFEDYEE